MPIYQPTNILPSSFAGYGNGVVDVNDNANISWQINGTSALSAFWIEIYDQDNNMNPTYNSGLLTTNCPAYGNDNKGNVSMFTFNPNMSWSDLGVGLDNNVEYFLNIIQFYKENSSSPCLYYINRTFDDSQGIPLSFSAGDVFTFYAGNQQPTIVIGSNDATRFNDTSTTTNFYYNTISKEAFYIYGDQFYTLQTTSQQANSVRYSASIVSSDSPYYNLSYTAMNSPVSFKTRAKPTVTIDSFTTPVAFGKQTISATYSQSDGDAISWVRWQFASVDTTTGEKSIIEDTGEIYTGDLTFVCDGMVSGNTYGINCIVESIQGVQAKSDWTEFKADYGYETSSNAFSVSCDQIDQSVVIQFPNDTTNILGVAENNDYEFTSNGLKIGNGNSISWRNMGNPTSLNQFWLNFQFATDGFTENRSIAKLYDTSDNLFFEILVTPTGYVLFQDGSGNEITNTRDNFANTQIQIIVHGASIGIRTESTLTLPYIESFEWYQIGKVSLIGDGGSSVFRYVGVTAYSPNLNVFTAFYYPPFNYAFRMLAFFADGYNSLQGGTSGPINKYTIYRQKSGELQSVYLGDFSTSLDYVKDYSVTSKSSYTYEISPSTYGVVFSSGVYKMNVCTTLKAYSLTEAYQDDENPNVYHAVNTFVFGNNIEAGSVTNNNSPTFLTNFTPYRYRQPVSQMGKSGVLKALLSNVSEGAYNDTAQQMNALYALSQSPNDLFLRDMKGNLYMVQTSSPIVQTINTKSATQEVSVSVPWEEIGDASNVSIVQIQNQQ